MMNYLTNMLSAYCQVLFKNLEYISDQNKESPQRVLAVRVNFTNHFPFLHLSPALCMNRKHYNGKHADSQLKDTGEQKGVLFLSVATYLRTKDSLEEEVTNEICSLTLLQAVYTDRHACIF